MLRTLRRIGFPLALLGLASVAVVTYTSLHQLQSAIAWRSHTHMVIEHIDRTYAGMLGAESLRRTYRLSRDRSNFDKMNARAAAALHELDTIEALTKDNPIAQGHVKVLRPIMLERITVLLDGIELPERELLDAATRDVQRKTQLHGTELTKLISNEIDAMRDEEQRLLTERVQRASNSADRTEHLILYGGVLGTGLVAFFYVSLVLENRRRMKSQAELQRSNAIVKGVLDGTTDAVVVKDLNGRYLLANPAALANFGRPEAEVLGKTDGELIPNATGERVMVVDREVMRTAKTTTFEQEVTIGPRTWMFLSTKGPYRNGDGEVAGIIAISRDITERKRDEARLAAQNTERGEIIAQLEEQTAGLATLAELAARLQSSLTLDELTQLIARFAARLLDSGGELGLLDAGGTNVESVIRWGEKVATPSFELTECRALHNGGLHVSSAEPASACAHVPAGAAPQICVAIAAQGGPFGLLQLSGPAPEGHRLHLLLAFTEQVGLALANRRLRETLQAQAIRDPLTGLFNRRYMDETLTRELSRAMRRSSPLSVIMIDVDHFKRVNDTHGHAAGDEVLRWVARLLERSVRREDVACRYGGEEFALIMPDLSLERAVERAELLRRGFAEALVEVEGRPIGTFTASFGVACIPGCAANGKDLIRVADEALYRAKAGGRNCVVQAYDQAGAAAS